ncbi:MAG: hypothetical protein SGILL_003589 [Bacillariaceae sp.]
MKKRKKKKRKHQNNRRDEDNKDRPESIVGSGATEEAANEIKSDDKVEIAPTRQDDTVTEVDSTVIDDDSSKKDSLAANLWWGNVWTQLLEDGDDENQVNEQQLEISSSDTDGLFQEIEELSSDSVDESSTNDDEEVAVDEKEEMPSTSSDVVAEDEVIEASMKEDDIRFTDSPGGTDGKEQNSVQPSYVSSGIWGPVDNLMTLGLASRYSSLRVSKQLRGVRKISARVTGLHGVLSGKPSIVAKKESFLAIDQPDDKDLQGIQRRIDAIDKARKSVERARAVDHDQRKRRKGLFGGLFRGRKDVEKATATKNASNSTDHMQEMKEEERIPQKSIEEIEEERRRMERVKEIDRLISEGQARLQNLVCEKDVLQRRPNPLFDYTTVKSTKKKVSADRTVDPSSNKTVEEIEVEEKIEVHATRKMNFPPDELVDEYLDMMISTGRLVKMNHTYLWKESEMSEDEEETLGDDLFTASADAHRLYQGSGRSGRNSEDNGNGKSGNGNVGGGGSWLLRQSLGGGPSLGEKIGEAAETAAYKAVCAALMSFLAKLLSSLHGINVLKHSDIRLVLEQAPDLPLMGAEDILPGSDSNYAEETIKTVIRRKTKKSRKRSKHRPADDWFVQRDAVTEMLLSHVQISAPLLKLFPLAWQRALLGNIITLATAVISDFLDGLRFQILGHELSFAFRPITEEDMIRHFQIMSGGRLNHRKYKAEEFEAAVRATAEDVSEELKFLDRWHERALGSGVLRTQIANMIARIVLTLTDEILSAARIDLWSAQAGGPRMLAGLEYRMESLEVEED